jgi:hypothetical protein
VKAAARRAPSTVAVPALVLLGTLPGTQVLAVPTAAATPPAGSYVSLGTQSRVVDTRTGAGGNHKGALKGGRTITVKVAGVGRVPSTGVGSVVVTVTAARPTGTGTLVLYGGTRPATTNLRFAAGQTPVTDTAVVPLASGRMRIANTAANGSVQVAVDVSGYYRSGTSSKRDPGIFHTLGTARRVVTLKPNGGASVQAAIGGHGGVPTGAGAAAVTLTVSRSTRAGTILGHRPDEPRQDLPLVRFAAGQAVSSFAVLRLSAGRATLVNTSSRAVRLAVDVAGWYPAGFAQTAQAFQTVVPTRVLRTDLGGRASAAVQVAGKGGVPLRNVSAVLVTLHALGPRRTGGLQAWRAGLPRPMSTTVLQFRDGRNASNVALVPVSSDGRIALHNTARGRTGLAVDVDGYVPATTVTPPGATATARYIRNITDSPTANTQTMHDEGVSDASFTFVLLDIGAQLNDGTGVALTVIDRRISYPNLTAAINAYLDGFASAGGHGVVALGTNNGGDFANFPAQDRGFAWAGFVDSVAAHPGVTIAGANDIEPGFASTEAQAEAWETAFLGATGADLVFNGSADGCPITWTTGRTCDFGWTEKQLYRLATGVGNSSRTMALPQIFVGAQATQWAMIDKTGGSGIRFAGSLTEHPLDGGTLTRGQGWTALLRAVSAVTTTSIGSAAADIHL